MTNNKKSRKNLFVFLLSVIFLAAVFLAYWGYNELQPEPQSPNQQVKKEEKKDEPFFTKPVNILVVGTDERGNEKSRTDTIMVYHLDPITKEVRLLSIPRDTYVNIPGRGMDKINHAHAFGEIELTMQTVEEFLGIQIDHYVRVNFEGFKGLVELIGGVTIDVEKNIKGTDIKPGLQTLNAEQALAYVRDRKDPMGDIARVKRQQKFIRALVAGVAEYEPKWKLVSVAPKLYSNVKTDIPITAGKELVTVLSQVNLADAKIEAVPGTFYNKNGISYWKPKTEEVAQIVSEIFGEPLETVTDSSDNTTN